MFPVNFVLVLLTGYSVKPVVMIWLIVFLALVFLILCLALLSIIILEVDTRIPELQVRLGSIINARIWYAQEWWIKIQMPFYWKTFRLADIHSKRSNKKISIKKKKTKKRRMLNKLLKKMPRVAK